MAEAETLIGGSELSDVVQTPDTVQTMEFQPEFGCKSSSCRDYNGMHLYLHSSRGESARAENGLSAWDKSHARSQRYKLPEACNSCPLSRIEEIMRVLGEEAELYVDKNGISVIKYRGHEHLIGPKGVGQYQTAEKDPQRIGWIAGTDHDRVRINSVIALLRGEDWILDVKQYVQETR